MFKVGQIVRVTHRPTRLWVIKERRVDGNVIIYSTSGSMFDFIDEKFLTLIGNNYKPKALPEQRGCRKEDC
jgi:hypothetical protein